MLDSLAVVLGNGGRHKQRRKFVRMNRAWQISGYVNQKASKMCKKQFFWICIRGTGEKCLEGLETLLLGLWLSQNC